jgi:hypothetical protein
MMVNKAHLHCHKHFSWSVVDLLYRAIIPFAEFPYNLNLIHVDLETFAILKVDTLGMQCSLFRKSQ